MTTSPFSPLPRTSAGRLAGWLLALSPFGFVLLIAASVATFAAAGIGLFDDIDRTTMDALGGSWTLYTGTLVVAHGIGGVGAALAGVVAARAGGAGSLAAAAASIVSALGVIGAVVGAALYATAAGFTTARLGDDPSFRAGGIIWSYLPALLALGVILLCVALLARGLSRAGAVVIGGLAALFALGTVATGGLLPPFAISLLWLPLGIVWLRALRRR